MKQTGYKPQTKENMGYRPEVYSGSDLKHALEVFWPDWVSEGFYARSSNLFELAIKMVNKQVFDHTVVFDTKETRLTSLLEHIAEFCISEICNQPWFIESEFSARFSYSERPIQEFDQASFKLCITRKFETRIGYNMVPVTKSMEIDFDLASRVDKNASEFLVFSDWNADKQHCSLDGYSEFFDEFWGTICETMSSLKS